MKHIDRIPETNTTANRKETLKKNGYEHSPKRVEKNERGNATLPVIFLIVMAALIAGFILIHSITPGSGSIGAHVVNPGRIRPETPETADNTEALRQEVNRLAADYQEDCSRLLAQYMDVLATNIDPEFKRAKDAVPRVVDDLSGFSACVRLSYKAAKDRIKGTRDFEDAYMAVIDGPIVQPCLRANLVASDMLQNLDRQLKERYARYAMDLAAACMESGEKTN